MNKEYCVEKHRIRIEIENIRFDVWLQYPTLIIIFWSLMEWERVRVS